MSNRLLYTSLFILRVCCNLYGRVWSDLEWTENFMFELWCATKLQCWILVVWIAWGWILHVVGHGPKIKDIMFNIIFHVK